MKLKRFGSSIMSLLVLATLLSGCASNTPASTEEGKTETQTEETTATKDTKAEEETAQEAVTYPITVTHAYGETVIESQPERVATIAWGNQDVPLALGVVPVGVSKANFGAVGESGLLPWTEDAFKELGAENPVVFDDTDGLNYEAISDTNPDVILAAYSGITQEEYDLLSQIAPVIAYPEFAWQTYWREQTLFDAKGMGKEKEAEELIADTEELISTKLSEYPDIEGKTAAFAWFDTSDLGKFYIYLPTDPRGNFLLDLGLKFPQSVMETAADESAFSTTISAENIDSLTDIDIFITYGDDTVLETLQADSLVGQIPAIANGAVVTLENTGEIAASSTPSVLSIRATIDEYLGLLDEAAKKVK